MMKYWNSFARKAGPLLAAGLLLQVGSCAVDPTALAGGLLTAVLNNLITSVVYGVFNIPLSGF
jgi:hypothetical protein